MEIEEKDIKWRKYKGLAGDLQTVLTGEYNNISFSCLYSDFSLANLSFRIAKRKIIKSVNMLHTRHKLIK